MIALFTLVNIFAHLLFAERLNHPVLERLLPDPTVTLYGHGTPELICRFLSGKI